MATTTATKTPNLNILQLKKKLQILHGKPHTNTEHSQTPRNSMERNITARFWLLVLFCVLLEKELQVCKLMGNQHFSQGAQRMSHSFPLKKV